MKGGGEGLHGRPWVGWNHVSPGCEPGEQDAGDHEGPPRHSPPPSPLRMVMGFSEVDAYEGRSIGNVHDKSAPTVYGLRTSSPSGTCSVAVTAVPAPRF